MAQQTESSKKQVQEIIKLAMSIEQASEQFQTQRKTQTVCVLNADSDNNNNHHYIMNYTTPYL